MRDLDFEDMSGVDWPTRLRGLHLATISAYDAYAELEYVISNGETDGPLLELAGSAYALVRSLRAAGMAELAAWEQEQSALVKSEDVAG